MLLRNVFSLRKAVTVFFVKYTYYLKGNVEKEKEKIFTITISSPEPTETFRSILVLLLKQSYEKISQGNKCNGQFISFQKTRN